MSSADVDQLISAYGKVANSVDNDFLISGRYGTQEALWKSVIDDVVRKLEIDGSESVLDIGCGPGLLTFPLLEKGCRMSVLDDRCVIDRLREKTLPTQAIEFHQGNFLTYDFGGRKFDRVLAYGVILYMPDNITAVNFVEKALSLVNPGGILLIGDIPNKDRKNRFLASEYGKCFDQQFRSQRAHGCSQEETARNNIFESLTYQSVGSFNETFLLEVVAMLRIKGHDAVLIPQNGKTHCFGYTREDLWVRAAYS